MTELVPFQEKRGKQFKEPLTPQQAVNLELKKYFTNYYPNLTFGNDQLDINTETLFLEKQTVKELPNLDEFSSALSLVTSPALLTDKSIQWNLSRLEIPVLLLRLAAKGVTKCPYLLLPKPYQKMIKQTYTSEVTLTLLSSFLKSKKRAKKYLRIFQKRLGIYTTRKPPFKKQKEPAKK